MFPSRRATLGGDVFRDEFSVSFDGTDEFIELGSQDGDLRLSGSNGAIIAWIKPTLTGDDNQRIVDKSSSGSANSGYALVFEKNGRIKGDINVATVVQTSTGVLVADKWQQITWTWDGTTHSIYVNGKLIVSSTDSTQPPSDTTNMRIGTWNHSTGREYQGSMSEVVIYNKGLSSSEVKTIYNGREAYNHKEGVCFNNLVAWYRMGDGALDRFGKASSTAHQNGIITDVVNAKLGNDLVTNGDFSNWTGDNPDNWTVNGETSDNTISQSGNAVRMIFTTGDALYIEQNILTANKTYKVTIDCTAISSGAFRVQDTNETDEFPINPINATGSYVGYFKATGTALRIFRNAAVDATFTNVTCREVLGNNGIMLSMTGTNITGNTP